MNDCISGIDMDEGIRRTGGSRELYLYFLKKFPEDPSYFQLALALGDSRMADAYIHAHTLKGLSAQLGITALQCPCERLCMLLRAGDAQSLVPAKRILEEMKPVYEEIIRGITALL